MTHKFLLTHRLVNCLLLLWALSLFLTPLGGTDLEQSSLPALILEAQNPEALYRPVPLWWWDGDRLEIERLQWQLDELHEKGVDQVCLIYLSPLRSQPPYFTEDWWTIYLQMLDHASSLGMKVWLTDGVAWGSPFINNSVLEINPEFRGHLLQQQEKTVVGPGRIQHEIPQGYELEEILGTFAYRMTGAGIDLEDRHELTHLMEGRRLDWEAPEGRWKVMIFYRSPMGNQSNPRMGNGRGYGIDFTNPEAMQTLIGLTTGEYERRVGSHMGTTIVGTFQDELVTHHLYGFPPYSRRFSEEFEQRLKYDLRPLLGALYHEAGPLTDKIRCDYFEVLVQLMEEAFYRPYFQWHEQRGMLVAHDQYGRLNLISQTWGYGDYFRTQSWFQAPGYDDWNQAVPGRNWRDAKLAASIAQLYGRSRVWVEALHSSGWGLDLQEQVLTVNENYIYGANLYDKHGFDYSTFGSWYNWAAPSAHYRMPYWMHYRPFADYVARLSFMQSQGDHLADIGIFYPVHTIQANYRARGGANDLAAVTESYFWGLGKQLLQNQLDFHFLNDASIQNGSKGDGRLSVSGVDFSVILLPPLSTIDQRTLSALEEFVSQGGVLISFALLPTASVQEGRGDPVVRAGLERIFGTDRATDGGMSRKHANGGFSKFVPQGYAGLSDVVRAQREMDLETDTESLMYQHRRSGELDFYMLYNRSESPVGTQVSLRATGAPYKFDSQTGQVTPIHTYEAGGNRTTLRLDFAPFEAYHVFFQRSEVTPALVSSRIDQVETVRKEGNDLVVQGYHQSSSKVEISGFEQDLSVLKPIPLDGEWGLELRPTMDNRWGDFRRPPSPEFIGPEVRQFRYQEEKPGADGLSLGWQNTDLDDSEWEMFTYSVGPYWWVLGPVPNRGSEAVTLTEFGPERAFEPDRAYQIFGDEYRWSPYSFSQEFGLEKDPDYWSWLGSKKSVDSTFLEFGEVDNFGLVYLFTNVYSPKASHSLLLSPTAAYWGSHRIWVNGEVVSDPYHRDSFGGFGSLTGIDLKEGWNQILIKTNRRHLLGGLYVFLVDQEQALSPGKGVKAAGGPRLGRFANSDLVFDIHGGEKKQVGWYRFKVPPGTRKISLHATGQVDVFVNGREEAYDSESGEIRLREALTQTGLVALRVRHTGGKYAGAAIEEPVGIEVGPGTIELGDWSDEGLLSYSGAAVYRKSFRLPEEYLGSKLVLDLGKVDASASVRVNGKEAGVRGWQPYRFYITDLVRSGDNEIEVTVANALANHYLVGTPAIHVYEGQTESGLFGPVQILPYTRVEMRVPGP